MRIARVNLYGSSQETAGNWGNVRANLPLVNMLDSTGTATTWDYSFNAGNPSYNSFNGGTGYLGGAVGSGDAAWVDSQIALREGIGVTKDVGWYATTLAGLDSSKQYTIELFGSVNNSNRSVEVRCNAGTSQTIDCVNNLTRTITFDSVTPTGAGEILIEMRAPSSSAGFGYLNAMRITELDSVVQDFTVTQTTVRPVDAISGTYTGWPDAPTTDIILTDSASNTLTLVASVTGGAGSGTWSATIPSLPSAGSDVEFLKFGATTISFAGFAAKSGPTLQVAATHTLATLAADFDDYVFQGWTPQPAVGDQLVTVTAEGVFNSNGDYTFYAEGTYPVWYVDGTGQAYGRTIDTSGLDDPEPTEQGILADILRPILVDVLQDV